MEQTLHLSNTTLVVTFRCNLKCKLCAVSTPYYPVMPHYSLESLKGSVKRYFGVVDYVDKFTINGGEPLLHPQLPDIMDFMIKYVNRIGTLEIITNGAVAPDKRLLNSLSHSDKIDILVDNYGPELSKKVPEIVEAFTAAGIKHRVRKYYGKDAHYGGWVDLSDLSKKNRTVEETEYIYKHCAYPGPFRCFVIIDGKAYICGVYKRCESLEIIPDNPSEYVDFSSDTMPITEMKKQIKNFYNRRFFSACEYCNGFLEDSKRYAPAEQI
ncbi:MAG: radical SAM protein [Bacillota bacterium]